MLINCGTIRETAMTEYTMAARPGGSSHKHTSSSSSQKKQFMK